VTYPPYETSETYGLWFVVGFFCQKGDDLTYSSPVCMLNISSNLSACGSF